MLKMKMHGGYPLCLPLRLLPFVVFIFCTPLLLAGPKDYDSTLLGIGCTKKEKEPLRRRFGHDMTWKRFMGLRFTSQVRQLQICVFSLCSDWSIFFCPYGTILRHIFFLALGLSLLYVDSLLLTSYRRQGWFPSTYFRIGWYDSMLTTLHSYYYYYVNSNPPNCPTNLANIVTTTTTMAERVNVYIPPHPAVLDSIQLRAIQLTLPTAPDPWHRPHKPQSCTTTLKLYYSSAIAAAAADDVSLALDYGKLYRHLVDETSHMGMNGKPTGKFPPFQMVNVNGTQQESLTGKKEAGEDVRLTAGIVANCALGLLDETAAGVRRMSHVHLDNKRRNSASVTQMQTPQQTQAQMRAAIASNEASGSSALIDGGFGQCEVWMHLPKALLRAEEGLKYRCLTVWGYRPGNGNDTGGGDQAVGDMRRCPVVLEEEFRIEGIRSYCILGLNSHERVEKQAVVMSLEFRGPGQLAWGSTVVDTYQEMTRVVAEVRLSFLSCVIPDAVLTHCSESRALPSRLWRRWRLSWRAL